MGTYKQAIKWKLEGKRVTIEEGWELSEDLVNLEEVKGKFGRSLTLVELHSSNWAIYSVPEFQDRIQKAKKYYSDTLVVSTAAVKQLLESIYDDILTHTKNTRKVEGRDLHPVEIKQIMNARSGFHGL